MSDHGHRNQPPLSAATNVPDELIQVLFKILNPQIISKFERNNSDRKSKLATLLIQKIDTIIAETQNRPNKEQLIIAISEVIYYTHCLGLPTGHSAFKQIFRNIKSPPEDIQRLAAEFSIMEQFEPEFRAQLNTLRARKMRDAKAKSAAGQEQILMNAIRQVRGEGPSPKPSKEAGVIIAAVNELVTASGGTPASESQIYRRLRKLPRS